jgi:hypothetical protein
MSTVAPRPPAPPANPAINPALLDSERYIDDHIGRTRRALKLADFSAGVIMLVAGVLAFLLVAGLIDHWIIPGGLGPGGRLALFGLLVLGVGWHAWRRFVPLLRSINPVYAAHTIEKSSPTLKNSLLNVILFRGHRQQMSAKVYHALEQQAAQRLSAAPAEASVDHAALLRLGYALLAVVAACTLYAVLSPKNLAVSAIRIIDPWADVAAPSRVKILNVEPGATSVARGERVAISAEVHAIGQDEPVRLRYSTDDQQLVDESITMTRPVGATRFTADLPRATDSNRAAGVMNNLEYWIEAGDARSPRFKLSVFDRPTIVVQRVEYHAPAYTGEPSRTVDNVGDIRGLEGTTVAIEALANQSIRTAYVDFDADGTNDLKMAIDGERATAGFELKLRPDRRTPLHDTYVLRYTTTEGRANSDPAQYTIDVTPDYAPEVRLTKPEEPEVTVRVGDTVQLGAEARDPDYALSQVRVMGRVGEKDLTVVDMPLKDGRGRFTGARMFTPADAGLKAGDVLEYWAEARDNRRPEANIGMSEHRRLRIVAADAPGGQQQNNRGGKQPQQDQGQGENGQGGQQGGAQQHGGEAGGEGESGDQGEGGQQGGPAGGQGESDQGQSSDSGEAASAAGQSGDENNRPGAEGSQGGQSGQGGAEGENGQQSNDQQANDQQANEQQGAEGTEGGEGGQQSQKEDGEAGEIPAGGKPGENGAAGGAQGGQQEKVSAEGDDDSTAFERIREHLGAQEGESGSQGSEREQQAGEQQAGGQQAGEQQQGAQRPGEQQNAPGENPRAGESGSGTERRGANENPNGQSADNPSAGELADDKPGEGEAPTEQGKPGAQGSKKPSGDGQGNSEGEGETPAGADGALNENNGKSPAGDDASGAPGAPEATTKRDRDGKPGDEGESAAKGEPPTDDARGKDESHARGDQSGDRSGSGQKGGGQQADNAGQGEAGSHTASDTGAGQSEDQGAGETGTEAGDEQLADGKTGESSGDKSGAGSEGGDAEGEQKSQGGEEQGDKQSGDAAGEQQQGAGGQQPGSSKQQSEREAGKQGERGEAGQAGQAGGQSAGDEAQSEAQGEQQSGAQAGGSSPGEGSNDPSDPTDGDQQGAGRGGAASTPPTHGGTQGGGVSGNNGGGEPGGDKANLDFARKQVDLVLEKLDDQLEQHKVDPKLLKSLGWTEDELRRFVTRWQGLKARAAEGGDDAADANAQLDAALRSLGLRQNGPQRFRAGAPADKLRDLNDAYRARAPQEYLDRVREYTKGVSAADEE